MSGSTTPEDHQQLLVQQQWDLLERRLENNKQFQELVKQRHAELSQARPQRENAATWGTTSSTDEQHWEQATPVARDHHCGLD
jgi:hypothetical protein